jgi:hypothetical protein
MTFNSLLLAKGNRHMAVIKDNILCLALIFLIKYLFVNLGGRTDIILKPVPDAQ